MDKDSCILTAFKVSIELNDSYYFKVFQFVYSKFSFKITKDTIFEILTCFIENKIMNEQDYMYFILDSEITHFFYFMMDKTD